MGPDCSGGGGGCSRPGCAGARLVGDSALLAAEAELLQQQQQQQASQKPYRVGLILLCVGALFNWLGLAQAYVEPMRYIGVGCIVAGALLICAAMCRWLGRSGATAAAAARPDHLRHNIGDELSSTSRDDGPIPSVHVISLSQESHGKPPDYESLVAAPPSYDDALKLRPSLNFIDETSSSSSAAVAVTSIPIDAELTTKDEEVHQSTTTTSTSPSRCER